MSDFRTLPLTGAGDSTALVAVLTDDANRDVQIVRDDAVDPQYSVVSVTNLAPGGNQDLNATAITGGKIGQYLAVDVGSSVPLRVDIQTVNGPRVTVAHMYTGLSGSRAWRTPAPSMFELATGNFGISVTNLSAYQTSDVRATIYWDEINP